MKAKRMLFACCTLLLIASVISAQPQSVNFPRGLSFTIDRHPGWSAENEEGGALNIRCTFRNETNRPLSFLLADHDDYLGTLAYPVMLRARVTDKDGNVLTHTAEFGDWWTSYVLSSGAYREMPGDRVTLKPGQKVVRIVPLSQVLKSLDNPRGELKAGEYTVELRLGDILSNRMSLKVVARQ